MALKTNPAVGSQLVLYNCLIFFEKVDENEISPASTFVAAYLPFSFFSSFALVSGNSHKKVIII